MHSACKKGTVASKSANDGRVTQMNAWLETEWAGVAQVFRGTSLGQRRRQRA